MKRPSEVVYTSASAFNLDYKLKPSFNFTNNAQLVDYSFTDDEDFDLDTDTSNSFKLLRSCLAQLGSPLPPLKFHQTNLMPSTYNSLKRDIKARVSLKLKDEERAERKRKDQLISQVMGDMTAVHVCGAEAPLKRRRLDINFISKRIVLRRSKNSAKKQHVQSKKKKVTLSERISGFFQKV